MRKLWEYDISEFCKHCKGMTVRWNSATWVINGHYLNSDPDTEPIFYWDIESTHKDLECRDRISGAGWGFTENDIKKIDAADIKKLEKHMHKRTYRPRLSRLDLIEGD